ncbi:hypothetical protein ENUP19_0161G0059 [Entamoeba nuttalli]|uniref:Uncharacterized protein n=1 Tax=Entamoeba nuttalli TaxID=412467 RepID=A0ABQ0DLS8_9EUKA
MYDFMKVSLLFQSSDLVLIDSSEEPTNKSENITWEWILYIIFWGLLLFYFICFIIGSIVIQIIRRKQKYIDFGSDEEIYSFSSLSLNSSPEDECNTK